MPQHCRGAMALRPSRRAIWSFPRMPARCVRGFTGLKARRQRPSSSMRMAAAGPSVRSRPMTERCAISRWQRAAPCWALITGSLRNTRSRRRSTISWPASPSSSAAAWARPYRRSGSRSRAIPPAPIWRWQHCCAGAMRACRRYRPPRCSTAVTNLISRRRAMPPSVAATTCSPARTCAGTGTISSATRRTKRRASQCRAGRPSPVCRRSISRPQGSILSATTPYGWPSDWARPACRSVSIMFPVSCMAACA